MFFSFARHAYGGLVKNRVTILRTSPTSTRGRSVGGGISVNSSTSKSSGSLLVAGKVK